MGSLVPHGLPGSSWAPWFLTGSRAPSRVLASGLASPLSGKVNSLQEPVSLGRELSLEEADGMLEQKCFRPGDLLEWHLCVCVLSCPHSAMGSLPLPNEGWVKPKAASQGGR